MRCIWRLIGVGMMDYALVISMNILPKPKPDPLVEALNAVRDNPCIRDTAEIANDLRAALAKLGHEVREIEG